MSATSSGNPNLPIHPAVALLPATQSDSFPAHVLTPADSPAMKFAVALCGEVFPGAPVDVELFWDPEEPSRTWYCLMVQWPGEPKDCVDRASQWYHRFDAAHREANHDFVVSVVPV